MSLFGGLATAVVSVFAAAPRSSHHHVHDLGAAVVPGRIPLQFSKPDDTPQRKRPAPTHNEPPRFRNTTWIVMECLDWLRSENSYGYFLSADIDHMIELYCDLKNYELPDLKECRSIIVGQPGVKRGRHRIKGPQFSDVRRRTHVEKPILYRISRTKPNDGRVVATSRPMMAGSWPATRGHHPATGGHRESFEQYQEFREAA
jgi:hypothetical protein